MFRGATLITAWMLFTSGAAAQTPQPLPIVHVELSVTNSLSKPIRNTPVIITALRDCCGSSPLKTAIDARTDESGIAHFDVPEGVYGLSLRAHGVGYGSTGRVEFIHGMVARPYLPPLAGYATIEGTIPVETCKRDVTVFVNDVQVAPDTPGHFVFADVPFGRVTLYVKAGGDFCSEFAYLEAHDRGPYPVTLTAISRENAASWNLPPPSASPTAQSVAPAKKQAEELPPVVWIQGTVRDEAGQPVAGAAVYVVGSFQGTIRRYEVNDKTETNAAGYYEWKGTGGLAYFTATLVVKAPGFAPAWAWPEFANAGSANMASRQTPLDPVIQDFVLPAHDGSLVVNVLQGNQPAVGATVSVYQEGASLSQVWALGDYRSRAPVEEAAYPSAKTDASGRANFEHLLPGRYDVYATTGSIASIRATARDFRPPDKEQTALAKGIPIQMNRTARLKLALFAHPASASFQIANEDGKPVTGSAAAVFGAQAGSGWTTFVELDKNGRGSLPFDHLGFWDVKVRYRDQPIKSIPIELPYKEAGGALALSALLGDAPPPLYTSHLVRPGSIRIDAQDDKGNPIPATVTLVRSGPIASATTSAAGSILFKDVYFADQVGALADNYYLNLVLTNPEIEKIPLVLGTKPGPLPRDEQLHSVSAILPYSFLEHPLPLHIDTENHVVIRPAPLRYVEGTISYRGKPRAQNLTSGPDHSSGEPTLWGLGLRPDNVTMRYEARAQEEPGTGRYVAGPFPSGHVELYFTVHSQPASAGVDLDASVSTPLRFDIDADQALQKVAAEVAKAHEKQQPVSGDAFLGMAGISVHHNAHDLLQGKVFLADGITPALGAQVFYFEADQPAPSLFAMADAHGDLHPGGTWTATDLRKSAPGKDESSGRHEAMLAALLPGSTGTVIQYGPLKPASPVRLVLPRSISVHGEVRVHGERPTALPGSIQVFAVSTNQNQALVDLMSSNATADADGYFTLSGLTPGDYFLQAALDDIWLSRPVKVRVSKDRASAINLSIPAPGVPVIVSLVDAAGKPAIGARLTINHAGPLATLWPDTWVADGAGEVYIPTLESGENLLGTPLSSTPIKVNVPPMGGKPVQVRVRAH